jgi:hypothetical protein
LTKPYALTVPSNSDGMVKDQVVLVTELEGRPVTATPRMVSFQCKVQPKQQIHELVEVPVRFLCPPQFMWRATFHGDEGKVRLRLMGPAGEEPSPVIAFVDLTGAGPFRGRNSGQIHLQLPKDFTLVECIPPVISFYLEECDRPMPASAAVSEDVGSNTK